jgi:hypothetical protein
LVEKTAGQAGFVGAISKFVKAIKLKLGIFAITLLALILSCATNREKVVQTEDDLQNKTWKIYIAGTFQEATNALTIYIQFLQVHQKQFSGYRSTNDLLYLANEHLAYMFLFSKNRISATQHFNFAYDYYKQMLEQDKINQPLPKSEFINYVLIGIGKVDAKTGTNWKRKMSLDTNVVNDVKELFVTEQ